VEGGDRVGEGGDPGGRGSRGRGVSHSGSSVEVEPFRTRGLHFHGVVCRRRKGLTGTGGGASANVRVLWLGCGR